MNFPFKQLKDSTLKIEDTNTIVFKDSQNVIIDDSLEIMGDTIEVNSVKKIEDSISKNIISLFKIDTVIRKRKKIIPIQKKEIIVTDSMLYQKAHKDGIDFLFSRNNFPDNYNGFLNNLHLGDSFNRNPNHFGDIQIYKPNNNISNTNNYSTFLKQPQKFRRFDNSIDFQTFNDWTVGIVFFSMLLLGWGKLFFSKYFVQILSSVYNYRLSINLFNDKNILLRRINGILNAVFTINVSIFIIQLYSFYSYNPFGFSQISYFLIFLFLIPIVYFVKASISLFIVKIFATKSVIKEYIFNVFLLNKSIGLYLFPVIVIIPFISSFSSYFIYLGLFIIIYFYILRIIRVVQIIFYKDVSILYLFLYLCTLEILPIVMVIKIISLYK